MKFKIYVTKLKVDEYEVDAVDSKDAYIQAIELIQANALGDVHIEVQAL